MTHRYNNDVKHIKILAKDGCFHIAENKRFRSILVSIHMKQEVRRILVSVYIKQEVQENTSEYRQKA
jgi:hypothetical protein